MVLAPLMPIPSSVKAPEGVTSPTVASQEPKAEQRPTAINAALAETLDIDSFFERCTHSR